jgi:hypothetical protein
MQLARTGRLFLNSFEIGSMRSGAFHPAVSFPCSLVPWFPWSLVLCLTANAPQSAPIRHGDAPNDAPPTLLRDAADAPNIHAPTHSARHPSGDTPQSTRSRDAAAAHNAPRSGPVARREPQPQPAPWRPQAPERELTEKQALSSSFQFPTSSSTIHRTRSPITIIVRVVIHSNARMPQKLRAHKRAVC